MSDLSGVVNEQKATIEALRRRVAELEGELSEEREGSKKAVAEIAKMHKWADKVIAENAELKRQVDALREASIQFTTACEYMHSNPGSESYWFDAPYRTAKAALLKAAKGEVE